MLARVGWEGALRRLEHVLVRFMLTTNIRQKKRFLFRREVEYLGPKVSGEGVCPLSPKGALKCWTTPMNLDLCSSKDTSCFWVELQTQLGILKSTLATFPALPRNHLAPCAVGIVTDTGEVANGALLHQFSRELGMCGDRVLHEIKP